jgi:hypothetical protein
VCVCVCVLCVCACVPVWPLAWEPEAHSESPGARAHGLRIYYRLQFATTK